MTKLVVGIVAVMTAAGGVSACGSSDKAKEKTPVAQTADVPIQKVEKTADIKPDINPVVFEPAAKTPKFTLVLSEGKSGFKFRSAMLSDEAKAKIDEMFTGDKVDLNNARFEIEGYTDNLGPTELNHQVGLARA